MKKNCPIYEALMFLDDTISNYSVWWVSQLAKYPNETITIVTKTLLHERIYFMQNIVDNKEMDITVRKHQQKLLAKARKLLRKL